MVLANRTKIGALGLAIASGATSGWLLAAPAAADPNHTVFRTIGACEDVEAFHNYWGNPSGGSGFTNNVNSPAGCAPNVAVDIIFTNGIHFDDDGPVLAFANSEDEGGAQNEFWLRSTHEIEDVNGYSLIFSNK